MVTTNLKCVSSMKLHRDLGITPKSAWFMLHRIRQAYEVAAPMAGRAGRDRRSFCWWERAKKAEGTNYPGLLRTILPQQAGEHILPIAGTPP